MSRIVQTGVAIAITFVAAACGPGSHGSSAGRHGDTATPAAAATQGPGGVQQVSIDATSKFRFEPSIVTAHPGAVRVTLVDTGSYPHNLSVADLHTTSKTVTGGLGQGSTTFTLNFPKAGTYPFVCTYHSSAGMRGQFVIR